jgi:hypothetical protein
VRFPCGLPACNRTLKTYVALKVHVSRDHSKQRRPTIIHEDDPALCVCSHCSKKFTALKELSRHLNNHISAGIRIDCPFPNCQKKYAVQSSFACHVSRHHKDPVYILPLANLQDENNNHDDNMDIEQNYAPHDMPGFVENESSTDDERAENGPDDPNDSVRAFLRNLALLFLMLQAKYHTPANTLQKIIEGFSDLHSQSQAHMHKILSDKIVSLGVAPDEAKQITDDVLSSDLFLNVNSQEGDLSSQYKRSKFYKQEYRYVEPINVRLGKDVNDIQRYCHYVPIKDTIQSMFQDIGVRNQYQITTAQVPNENTFSDFTDGSVYKNIELFKRLPGSLKLILYQDAFEVANPLGSGKKKHKLVGVYLTLGNLLPHSRSQIDPMQLILICRDVDFKYFGIEKIFRRLIMDLKDIETNGIDLGLGEPILGAVVFIAGDNLGHHCIGGFVENFSTSNYVCRFCHLHRKDLQLGPNEWRKATFRTKEDHSLDVEKVKNDPTLNNSRGVKFESTFNQLLYYHVANPGLAPCLGHDLFEGVVAYDMALFVNHFISENWFSCAYFNRALSKFRFKGHDNSDRPCPFISGCDKLGGHAVQNWNFLRFFPIIVANKMKDCRSEAWQLVLLLQKIVEYVCAPEISKSHVGYLQTLIDDYLYLRRKVFPDTPFRPKHHYLWHYPVLILQFGCLVRVWTLRFESKHSYFKRCIRMGQNFKNVTKTCAQKHQLLQAYYSAGSLFGQNVQIPDSITMDGNLLRTDIVNAVDNCRTLGNDRDSLYYSDKVIVHGTSYQKGMVVLARFDDEGLSVGTILLVVFSDIDHPHLVLRLARAEFDSRLNVYELRENSVICLQPVSALLDYYPLQAYFHDEEHELGCYVIIKHAFLDVMDD